MTSPFFKIKNETPFFKGPVLLKMLMKAYKDKFNKQIQLRIISLKNVLIL